LSEKRRAVEQLEGERTGLEEQLQLQKRNFDQLGSERKEQEGTLRGEIEKLKKALQTAQTNASNAKEEELRSLNAQLESLNKNLSKSETKYAELEKKASAWTEEKKALLERCLNTESDLDFERERAAENKRRFDNALSAMHELGRANQSLQV
uniref:Early endosome antigen 1 (inferred by orthology to a human protein) n=1 Tax=Anisakis simplex TaxID=6269 RepID=A0A0M3KIK9_ANISI